MMSGRLEVICGPMFGGKTEELIRRIKRCVIAKQKVEVFKPSIDNRYSETEIVSHGGIRIVAKNQPINFSLVCFAGGVEVVAIDEIQFFNEHTVSHINCLVEDGTRVIVSGLDLDSFGKPFGIMPQLLAMADEVIKVNAVCVVCQGVANRTYRKVKSTEQVAVGGSEMYEPRCINCWKEP